MVRARTIKSWPGRYAAGPGAHILKYDIIDGSPEKRARTDGGGNVWGGGRWDTRPPAR